MTHDPAASADLAAHVLAAPRIWTVEPSLVAVPDPLDFWEGRTRAVSRTLEEAEDAVASARPQDDLLPRAVAYVLSRGLRHLGLDQVKIREPDLLGLAPLLQSGPALRRTLPQRLAVVHAALAEGPAELMSGWNVAQLGDSVWPAFTGGAHAAGEPEALLEVLERLAEMAQAASGSLEAPSAWSAFPALDWLEATGVRMQASLRMRVHPVAPLALLLSSVADGQLSELMVQSPPAIELRGGLVLPELADYSALYGVEMHAPVVLIEDPQSLSSRISGLRWNLAHGTPEQMKSASLQTTCIWPQAHPNVAPEDRLYFDDPEPISLLSAGLLRLLSEAGRLV